MKVGRPYVKPADSGRISHEIRQSRPDWFREWLENQGRYALLDCGHYVDINDRSVAYIIGATDKHIVCPEHNQWALVVRSATFTEYMGIPPNVIPDTPPF